MEKEIIFTQEGYDNLVKKLEYYKSTKSLEASERIAAAREYGDLSENAEYSSAKDAQALLEAEISEMEEQIAHAKIISNDELEADVVYLGNTVKIYDFDMEEESVYKIVGQSEASIIEGKISNDSPLAQAIVGHKVGESVEVNANDFKYTVKILEIIK